MGQNSSHIKSVYEVINELEKMPGLVNFEELSELFKQDFASKI